MSQVATHQHHVSRRSRSGYQALPVEPSVVPDEKRRHSVDQAHARRTSLTLNLLGQSADSDDASGSTTVSVSALVLLGFVVVCSALSGFAGYETGQWQNHSDVGVPLQETGSELCNPYDQPGYMHVNLTTPGDNRWVPVGAPEGCSKTTDWVSLLAKRDPRTNFLRNRSIVLFGDSVDRDHNEHLCALIGGNRSMIGREHPLSPPPPVGRERPAKGELFDQVEEWPDCTESRPFVCHVPDMNLVIINVFYFGYQPDSPWIHISRHFHPPEKAEDRFDQILVPLYANVAAKLNLGPAPDVVSISPTFWTTLRHSLDGSAGVDVPEEANEDFMDHLNIHAQKWLERRTTDIVTTAMKAWSSAQRKPLILWRSLHHVRQDDLLPLEQLQALDGVTRGAVTKMVREAQEHLPWHKRAMKVFAFPSSRTRGSLDLASRLRIDNWGALMIGQERHFRDHIHPHPLPGSYVYGNGLFEILKLDLEHRRH